MVMTFNWQRMRVDVRRGDHVQVLDTGTAVAVCINGRMKRLGTLHELIQWGWITPD